ncbi:MAG: OmpH family outer membrane protein [Alphaproteobacteria bacterium]|nr:OmpH family outer membrane protein [Alphaproteobacteria bacterium]
MQKLLLYILLVSIAFSANADTAILDVDKIITNSIAYKKFKKDWDKESETYQKEIESYETKMIELDKRIISGSNRIDNRDLEKLKKELADYEFIIQKLVEKRKNILDASFSTALGEIRIEIKHLVDKYAKSHKIKIIIPKSQTIYSDENVEITDNILYQLNEAFKDITKYKNKDSQ